MLPAGRASSALVLGSACPERLTPAPGESPDDATVDLIVLAPTDPEAADTRWLERAAAACEARLAADGIAYALLPRRRRRGLRRLLRARGLRFEPPVIHLPDPASSEHLVPLTQPAAGHAFRDVVGLAPWKRAAIAALLALRAGEAIGSLRDGVALVARRADAAQLFAWVPVPASSPDARRSGVIRASFSGRAPSAVVQPFAGRSEAPVVAKLSLDPNAAPALEEARLTELGPAARRAGAAVPEPLPGVDLAGVPVVIETRIAGEVVAPLLRRSPQRLADVLRRVAAWLAAWHRLTAKTTALTEAGLERELLGRARLLAPHLEGGERYLAAIEARCRAAVGAEVPLAAAHNDLTMWNVLVDRRGGLGIVDWEEAEPAALPLRDLFYAAADAVAATRGYADRPATVRECFAPGGAHADAVGALRGSVADAVGLPPAAVELAFHACWLGHAANELRSAGPADPTPFRDILGWVAERDAASGAGRA
jgi:Phosphotransferase enzyme family